ncbi:MAG: hypothetical protein NTZ54_08580 [Alphaproteobacteria bacterium]|nr:hypothetical protein [Alphaproteobacteria bacterium]
MGEEAHCPTHGDGQQHKHAKSKELHQFIGEHGTGIAQPVACRTVERVVEGGIVDRPRGQRQAGRDEGNEQQNAGDLEKAALQEYPDGRRDRAVVGVVGRLIRHHKASAGETFRRP